jgi:hypothetical protein
MPYGIEPTKLDSVLLDGKIELAVYPQIMKELNLQPGQAVDDETAKKIIAENERFFMAK